MSRLLWIALVAPWACACASVQFHIQVRPGRALKVDSVAVYPMGFRWSEPAYRSFQLSQALVPLLIETERFAVFGPGEFKIYRASDDNPIAATDLADVLTRHGLPPTTVLALRPWAEKQVESDTKQAFDSTGHPVGQQRVERLSVLLHLEISHGEQKEDIAEITARVEQDPFAEREDTDPMPEVTRALQQMVELALQSLDEAGRLTARHVHRDIGFSYLWVPRILFDYEEPGRPALEKWLATQDLVTKEAARLAAYKFFLGGQDDHTIGAMLRLPGGLWITDSERPGDGLRRGDVILEVAGEPATPQVLHRHLRAVAHGAKIRLDLRRGPDRVSLQFPVRG